MKSIIICLLFITIANNACTQISINKDTLRARYENETIRLYSDDSLSDRMLLKRLSYLEKRKSFLISPDALTYFDKYVKKDRTAKVFGYIGLTFFAASIAILNTSREAGSAFLLGGYTAFIFGLPIKSKGYNAYRHAVWLRNRDVLLR
jgi:hypothetical protein